MKLLMNIIASIGAVFTAFGNWLKHQTHRSELKNTPEMIEAKKRQDEADAVAKTTDAVRHKKIDQIRKELSDQ